MSKTIGVLVIDLEDTYSKMLWPSIARTIRERGHNCLILPANNPRHPYNFLYQYNHLFNFISSDNMDALILVPSTIMSFLGSGESLDLISRIRKEVPIISLNHQIEGVPSLLPDFTSGIKDAIHHLVHFHHYKKIGFVEGPPENPENQLRKAAFLSALKSEGLGLLENWLFTGDFTRTGGLGLGNQYGRYWVEEFDALFTANDYTAFGIMNSLRQQGYIVPDDLAIIGFDNVSDAPYSCPPLSSVEQPFAAITAAAAHAAIDLCEGKDVKPVVRFETKLVKRKSCGCKFSGDSKLIKFWQQGSARNKAVNSLENLFSDNVSEDAVERIVPVFAYLRDQIRDNEPCDSVESDLINSFESVIDNEMFKFKHFPDWCTWIIHFIAFCRENFKEATEQWLSVFLDQKWLYMVSRKRDIWDGYVRIHWKENEENTLNELQVRLSRLKDLSELTRIAEYVVNRMRINNCYISLLNKGRKKRGLYSTLPGFSKIVFAVKDGVCLEHVSVDTPAEIASTQIWPVFAMNNNGGIVWTISPLFCMDELYGFMVNEIKNDSGVFTNGLARQLSLSIQRFYLDDKKKRAETELQGLLSHLEAQNRELKKDSLHDELTGLWNRRGFMLETEAFLQACRQTHMCFFIYFADMDGLKEINDNHGHPEGDHAIVDMARVLQKIFREEDLIARLGGDEFIILSGNVSEDFYKLIEDRLETEMKNYNRSGTQKYALSFSMGFAFDYTDNPKLNLDEIMKKADDRLYVSKRKRKYGNSE